MVLTAVFVLVAAVPAAGILDGIIAFAGNRVASRLEERRLARLLAEIECGRALFGVNKASVDKWVAETCGAEMLDPLDEVAVGKRSLLMNAKQYALLEEAVDDEDSKRLRPLLTKVLLQTEEGARRAREREAAARFVLRARRVMAT